MEKIVINEKEYEMIENVNEAFDLEVVKEKLTDYFDEFDIIVGDWAYGKVRLKGFNEKGNKNFKPINDATKIKDYILNNCAYGCKWFEIKKIK